MAMIYTEIDESIFEWIAQQAPIRVGIILESLEYNNEECNLNPDFKKLRSGVENRFKYLTHIVAVDEKDVERINQNTCLPAMWYPSAVPKNRILTTAKPNPNPRGSFIGNAYGPRAVLLKSPEVQNLLIKQRSPEDGTIYPYLFTLLHAISIVFINSRLPGVKFFYSFYIRILRKLRRVTYMLLLKAFQTNAAVVNLPSMVKAYPGRVIEGMAAGRPVISWEIPDRPKNKALFLEGEEILLYSNDPRQLASHIQKIIDHPDFAERVAVSARKKLLASHTIEQRVKEILTWIETGDLPTYT